MCIFPLNRQPLQEPAHLLCRDVFDIVWCPGPLETHVRQKLFCCQKESVSSFKTERFQTIPFFIAEQKHTDRGIGGQMIFQGDESCEPLNLFSKISRATSEEDMFRPLGDHAQHMDCRSRSAPETCPISAFLWMPT